MSPENLLSLSDLAEAAAVAVQLKIPSSTADLLELHRQFGEMGASIEACLSSTAELLKKLDMVVDSVDN